MAVPTHLFKIIFLEFTNNDGKKSFWLETLIVSNGQEGEVKVVDEENVEEKQEEEFEVDEVEEEEEEEEEGITAQIEMGDNIWYILAKDEAEIDTLLKVGLKSKYRNFCIIFKKNNSFSG